MDKALAGQIGKRVKELLKPLEDELGYAVSLRGGNFSPCGNLLLKVEFAERQGTVIMTREATRLVDLCGAFGLPEDCLGKEFVSSGKTFTLTGMTARSAKWPFIARNGGDGKTYRLTERAVLAGFGIKRGETRNA